MEEREREPHPEWRAPKSSGSLGRPAFPAARQGSPLQAGHRTARVPPIPTSSWTPRLFWRLPPRQMGSSLLGVRPLHSSASWLQHRRRKPEDPEPRELDLVRYDMKDLMKAPKPALYLGFSGLIPFIFPPLVMAMSELYVPEIAYAQVAYGASIVSFLGGARWGFALPDSSPAKPDWMNLTNAVVPSILAWIALLFRDSITEASLVVIMGLGISLHYDLALLPTYPSWFKALRTVITVVATFSLVATLFLKGVYPERKLFADK
uniref:Transmembrane protein 69 n=1 Tax=Paramormyrops kingsleyae TaxID=1676925 RepID=A0A3B3RMS0_9TELE